MSKRQTDTIFTVNNLPYKAVAFTSDRATIRVDSALTKVANTTIPFNQEDADNICAHPDQMPKELRGHTLITHYADPNKDGYRLFIRVGVDGAVTQDLIENNRERTSRYTRVLVRG